MPLPFRPRCMPTALGPLPYTSSEDAWKLVLRYVPNTLPLPLLAHAGEDALTIAADGLGGTTVGPEQLVFEPEGAFAALDELYLAYLQDRHATRAIDLAALDEWTEHEAQLKRADAVSAVLMGPISLSLRLADEQGRTALTNAMLVDAVVKHLYLRLRWQHAVLSRAARVVLHWLYEPYFTIVGSPFSPIGWSNALSMLQETFGANEGVRGIWLGEATDVSKLLADPMFEVVGLPLPLPNVVEAWAPELRRFIQRRGAIGWGIVPQTAEGLAHARVGRLAARFTAVLRALEDAGLATPEVVDASFIMPEDTLGNLEPREAETALQLTKELSGMLRHSYGLD